MHVATVADLPTRWDPAVCGIHLQFTDRVFGSTPAAAAEAVRAVVAGAARQNLRVTATLHDVPQPSDGEHFRRRTEAYGRVCDALHGVVVNSRHERLLLAECGIHPERIATVRLPVRVEPAVMPAATQPPTVGIFGFLYPGKGHLEVIAALRGLDPTLGLLAIGEPSAGHDDLLLELREAAARQGRTVVVTGHVPEPALDAALREVTVPVAHHRHVSASGSLNAWLAAGRRPLAPRNRYTAEMSEGNPDAFALYPDDEDGLRHAIGRAVADPTLTWLLPGTVGTPTAAEAAESYHQLFARWHR